MQVASPCNENQNRYTKRQEQRRKIDSILRSDDVEKLMSRRSPSETEAAHFITSIKENRVCEFGLSKLCNLKLDELHHIDQFAGNENASFLSFAIQIGRDKIAMALIRAGASPMDNIEGCNFDSIRRSLIMDHPPSYIVWLLKFVCKSGKTSAVCTICEGEQVDVIHMESCRHTVCQCCFWSNINAVDALPSLVEKGRYNSLLCPIVSCISCGVWNTNSSDAKSTTNRLSFFDKPPLLCKESSYSLWCQLPAGFTHQQGDNGQPPRPPPKSTGAMHLAELAQNHLGSTRMQRNEELIKACAKADLRRMAALVEAGVHIDYQDEYGMTPLMVCAWLGHFHAVRLLIAAGSDANVRDAMGNTALNMALHANVGSDEIVQAFLMCLTGADTVETATHHATISVLGAAKTMSTTLPNGILSCFEQSVAFAACAESAVEVAHNGPVATTLIPMPESCSYSPIAADFWRTHGVKGAEKGAFCFDNCFSLTFLQRLLEIFHSLPAAVSEKTHCAARSYFCDVQGEITSCIEETLTHVLESANFQSQEGRDTVDIGFGNTVKVFPQMRFMHYQLAGSALAPHVDLHRKDIRRFARRPGHDAPYSSHKESPEDTSTHTLILYLTDCQRGGGETVLLKSLNDAGGSSSSNSSNNDQSPAVLTSPVVVASLKDDQLAAVSPQYGRLLLFPHNCPHEGKAILAEEPKILLRGEVFLS